MDGLGNGFSITAPGQNLVPAHQGKASGHQKLGFSATSQQNVKNIAYAHLFCNVISPLNLILVGIITQLIFIKGYWAWLQ
jgi:hypothetical protein